MKKIPSQLKVLQQLLDLLSKAYLNKEKNSENSECCLKLKKSCGDQGENRNDEDDEDESEDDENENAEYGAEEYAKNLLEIQDKKNSISLFEKFLAMNFWAFGTPQFNQEIDKKIIINLWSKLHPDLPIIKIPEYLSAFQTNIVIVMQISPHYENYLKQKTS